MQPLSLTTPSLLFSAITLILLSYTNRFLSYAQLVRTLQQQSADNPARTRGQIANLYRRLRLIRAMQVLGVGSLLLCVVAMFCIYITWQVAGEVIFGLGMISLALSLALCLKEILISIEALHINLESMGPEEQVMDEKEKE
ncbi:DUF2721 domain-containing protein [Porphyromonas cangingivalis]|uniref:Membrane protein n=1 Tax=Porphyromonas cangingivalis TaxID=36874 RepID=A0A099X036_PORCN|nr:DUF2721 domain-containing protein [Porphyromonas cangingivalis]KGL50178.1 membrane protein [Porphyromonas cangingivalis]KGN80225.1 membrane protein [Porphyromonas cangingivalis]SJZ32221.1 Protein of unknown function [Porphyromonas cangingivalis]SPY35965.1 Protein of uncharacterised function (DUF2721) [Porphyromonas cangingivalis]VEJ04592.1 Protein of uncharacterised function (DUF2721) [Porphyromonas cangingivalis]